MKSKLIADEQVKTFVIIFDSGDEVASGLKKFAHDNQLSAASFKAIGAFEKANAGSCFDGKSGSLTENFPTGIWHRAD